MRKWLLFLPLLLSISCKKQDDTNTDNGNSVFTTFTDTRDGQVYKTIKVGAQTWFAENLRYDVVNNWLYGNDANNLTTYGRLYDWNTARTACPNGWHLPSKHEWLTLIHTLGGDTVQLNNYNNDIKSNIHILLL